MRSRPIRALPRGARALRGMMGPAILAALFAIPSATGQEAPPRKAPEGLTFANGLFRDRHYGLAVEEFERFLKKAPPGPDADDARYGLANSLLFLGKHAEARRQFEEFLKAAPNHANAPTARFRVGETAYFSGDMKGAREALEAFTEANPGHRNLESAWPRLGDVYSRLGEPARARQAYEKALDSHPEGPLADHARLGLGRTLAALGETDAALKVLGELSRRNNRELADQARFQIGQVQAAAGRPAEAVEAFDAFEKASPRSPLAAESRLRRAEALAKIDRRDEAEALLKPLAADAPQALASQAAYALGTSQLTRGKAADALATFDGAMERFPGSSVAPALLFRSAEASLRDGHPADARARFLKLVEGFPKDPWADDALVQAADLALRARDAEEARALAASFAKKFPGNPLQAQAHLIEARAALDAGKAREAIDLFNGLLTRDKPGPEVAHSARYYLVLAYRADGQKGKAVEVLDDLAKTPAANIASDAQFRLGQAQVETGRFAEAVGPLEKYLEAKPDGEVADHALAYLAWARLEQNQPDAALADLQRLAERFPRSKALAPTRVRLAEAALAAKQFPRAAELFRPVAEGDDATYRPRAQSGLGWALLQDGQPAEAAKAFGALLETTPDDPAAPEAALARARALDEAGQPEGAIAAYALAAEKYPKARETAQATLARARLLAKAKRPAEAADAFAKYLDDAPKDGPEEADVVLAEWGWALLDADKPAEADKAFARLLEQFPDSPRADDARLNLAESAYQAKRFDEVAERLAPLVAEGSKADPTLIQSALYRLGRTQVERKDWTGASASFARLASDSPDGTFGREARFWKAEAAFQSGDAKGAESAFGTLVAGPTEGPAPETWLATARLRRVQSLVLLERWAEALEAADALKGEVPKDYAPRAEIDYARGRSYQGLAKFDEAREAYQAVIEARKGGDLAARAQLMRGETYFHQKEYAEALRELLKVDILYNAPKWQAAALLEAGKVYEQLDQWANAAEIYKKVRSRFPDDPNAAEAGRRLEAAQKRAGGDDVSSASTVERR